MPVCGSSWRRLSRLTIGPSRRQVVPAMLEATQRKLTTELQNRLPYSQCRLSEAVRSRSDVTFHGVLKDASEFGYFCTTDILPTVTNARPLDRPSVVRTHMCDADPSLSQPSPSRCAISTP